MNRPQKIRQVYAELRSALGQDVPSHEVLSASSRLVDIVDGRHTQPGARQGSPRPTFEELPLDKAFADGGWRIMKRESLRLRELYTEEPEDTDIRSTLKTFGMELAA